MRNEDWRGKRVCITGGAGFIGSHLTESLLALGADVACVDLNPEPRRLRAVADRVEYHCADIVTWNGVLPSGKKPEVIFHLAALAQPIRAEKEPEAAYRHNVMGTANMLAVARRISARRFIFISGGAVYTNIPAYLPMDEKHPIDPGQNVYAMTKRLGELLCEEASRVYGLSCAFIRLFNTYGPRQDPEYVIPSFIHQARREGAITVFNGGIVRDFNYVEDVVSALIRLAASEFKGGPVNIGTGKGTPMGTMARTIAEALKAGMTDLNRETFGPKKQICDNTLAKNLLQWDPVHSVESGLQKTIRAYLDDVC